MLVGRVGDVGMADADAGLADIKGIEREDVVHVLFGAHPPFEGGIGAGVARENGLDLVRFSEGGPFDGEAVSGCGDVVIWAKAIGIDVIKVSSATHVGGAGTGHRSEAGVPNEALPFLLRVSSGQSCHLLFGGLASVARSGLWSDGFCWIGSSSA